MIWMMHDTNNDDDKKLTHYAKRMLNWLSSNLIDPESMCAHACVVGGAGLEKPGS